MSGLPRSGSTLFQQIISQNPNFHASPTSGLINFFMHAKRNWKDNNEFRAQGLTEVEQRVNGSFRGILEGFYQQELREGKLIFDKSRGWMAYVEYLKEIYQNEDVKVICVVRDVRAILASFEKLYRNRSLSYPEFADEDFLLSQSVEGRAEILLRKGGVIGLPIARLRDALRRCPNNIILVPYQQLLSEPTVLFQRLHDMLGIQQYFYDFDDVKQVTQEEDVYHGYKGLHDIKEGKIVAPEGVPWEGMFDPAFIDDVTNAYADINKLCEFKPDNED